MNKKGFTLLELLVVMTIFAIVMPVVFNLAYTGTKIFSRIEEKIKQTGAVENTLLLMTEDIHNALEIEELSSNRLLLNIDDKTQILYKLSDGTLTREDSKTSQKILRGIKKLKWVADMPAPNTRHIILMLEVSDLNKNIFYTSIAKRKWKN